MPFGKRLERLSCPGCGSGGRHGMAMLVYSSVEIHPLTIHPDTGFVCAPGASHRLLILPALLRQLRGITDHPAKNGAWCNRNSQLVHDSGQVPIAELEPQVPPDTLDDDFVGKPTLRKYRVSSPSPPTFLHLLIIGFTTQMQQSPTSPHLVAQTSWNSPDRPRSYVFANVGTV